MPDPEVRPGQIWADRDRRMPHRRITIHSADPDGFAEVYSWHEDRTGFGGVNVRIRTQTIPRRFRLDPGAATRHLVSEQTTSDAVNPA